MKLPYISLNLAIFSDKMDSDKKENEKHTKIKSNIQEKRDGMEKNKTLRVATSLMLVASTAAVAVAPTNTEASYLTSSFKDVTKGQYYHDAIVTLTNENILNGYGDQTFRPNVPTTRGHIAIVLTRILGLKASTDIKIHDMPTSHNTYEYAAAAIEHGFMQTDRNNYFNPKNELTRYEYAEILMHAYNLKPTYKKQHQFKNVPRKYKVAVQTVFDHGLMHGVSTTNFGGYENITRGQMAVTLINARAIANKTKTGTVTTKIVSYNLVSKKIVTTDGDFKIGKELEPLFTNKNKKILQNAIITAGFSGKELVSIQDIELVNPILAYTHETYAEIKPNAIASRNNVIGAEPLVTGDAIATNINRVLDLGGITIPGKIILKRERTTIRNGSVGQIIATDEADRSLTVESVKVKDVIVEYGYYRDFVLTLTDTAPNYVTIDRNYVHLKSNKKVPQVIIADASSLQSQAAIGTVQLMRDGYVSLYGQISIDRLLVAKDTYAYIGSPGYIKEAEVLDRDGRISLTRNVRIGTVTIPTTGSYDDYLYYYGNIKEAVAKVKIPGSEHNLFHDEIQLPSKEEIQRQELFNNLVDNFEATANNNELILIAGINSYSTSMRDYPVRLSFTLTSGLTNLPSNTVIPTTITYKGHTTKHNFTVANLRQGILTVNSKGELLTLKDLAPNSNNRLVVQFDTPFPMTVRGNLQINGYSKGTAEAFVNTQFEEDVKTFINALATTSIQGGAKIEKRYGTVADQFDQLNENITLRLTNLRKPEADSKIVPFLLTYSFDGVEREKEISNVTLAQLKNSVSLYSLLDMYEKKLLKTYGNKVETWTIQFTDTIDADFQTYASVEGITAKTSSFTASFENTAVKAVNDLATSVNKGVVKVKKTYNTINPSLVNKAQDVKMTLTEVTTPSSQTMRVPFTINYKFADGHQTKKITSLKVEDLNKGVSLYTWLGMEAQKVTADLNNKIETFEIEFKETLQGELKFEAIVGNVVEQLNTAKVDSKVAAIQPVAKQFTATVSNNAITLKRQFEQFDDLLIGTAIDAKLFVTDLSKLTSNDTVNIAVKRNGGNEIIKAVPVSELITGKSLYSLVGIEPKLTAEMKNEEETWSIRFLEMIGGDFTVNAYQDGQEIGTPPAHVKVDVGMEIYNINAFTAEAADNGLKVTTIFGDTASSDETVRNYPLDAFLKVTSGLDGLPADREINFTISQNSTKYPGLFSTTVGNLTKGVTLSEILNPTAPQTLSTHKNRTDEWIISFDDSEIEPLQLNADVSLLVNDTAISTVKDVEIKNNAAIVSQYVGGFDITSHTTNEFTTTLNINNSGTIATPFENLGVDARLKITSPEELKQENYAVTITVGQNSKKVKPTKNQLIEGVKLSTLFDITPTTLGNHAAQSVWNFKVSTVADETFDFQIELLIGDYIVKTVQLENFELKQETK